MKESKFVNSWQKRIYFPGKSIFALILCLMLCGCAAKNTSTESHLETRPYITEQQVNSIENLTIYVYNEESSRLESRIVQTTISPDQTKADAALSYLLSMPEFEFALNSYGVPDYTLTISGGIARVNITNGHEYTNNNHHKGFALHFSIVNTLCSINGINYVSVYAGNTEMAGDVYIGPSRFLETSINDHYMEYYGSGTERNNAAQHPMLLYFGEKGESYIVPEPQQVYTNIDSNTRTINAVLEKMSSAPTNSADLISPVASDVTAANVNISGQAMNIDFNKNPCPSDITNQTITYAALFNTFTAIYPEIRELVFTVGGEPITINGNVSAVPITKDTFPEIIGTAVTLYMAQNTMDSLYPVNKYLSASSGISVTHIMEALTASPADSGMPVTSPILGGLTMDNIISARVVNDVAIVNFDTSFYDSVKGLSKTEETIMVYGIVNTLTDREQISKVQFLINNQSFDTVNGHIYYSQPLFSNPGLTNITQ